MPSDEEIEAAAQAICKTLGGDWKWMLQQVKQGDSTENLDWHRSHAKAALEAAERVRLEVTQKHIEDFHASGGKVIPKENDND